MYDMCAYRIRQTITCEVINELSHTFRINFMLSALIHRTVSLGFLPFLSIGITPICSGEWGAVLLVNVDKLTLDAGCVLLKFMRASHEWAVCEFQEFVDVLNHVIVYICIWLHDSSFISIRVPTRCFQCLPAYWIISQFLPSLVKERRG